MTICNLDDCTHYGCQLRRKGIQLSPRVGMSTQSRNWRPRKDSPPSHYAEIQYDHRPGGTKIPLLNPDGTYVRGKQAYEQRRKIDSILRRKHQTDTVPSP